MNAASEFPSGTQMLFNQTEAPDGWKVSHRYTAAEIAVTFPVIARIMAENERRAAVIVAEKR